MKFILAVLMGVLLTAVDVVAQGMGTHNAGPRRCAVLMPAAGSASAGVSATGGNSTNDIGVYRIHTFTNNGTFTVSSGGNVDILLVGGGGGGGAGWNGGGGGGGGGIIYTTAYAVATGTYSIVVGAGGMGGPTNNGAGDGTNGGNSVFGGSLTAYGGGGGGGYFAAGLNGGCGGGAGRDSLPALGGTGSQGYNGGQAGSGWGSGGGGGGAGSAGTNGGYDEVTLTGTYSQGGAGKSYDISGTATFYAGGGGGAWGQQYGDFRATGPAGGIGGGGKGYMFVNEPVLPTAGTNGLGGGGGAGGGYTGTSGRKNGAAGGSGIVIVRYSDLANYPYKMKIQFSGYTKSETLTNFPALVVFTNGMGSGSFQYSQFASTNGWDLRFTDAGANNWLNYESEQWNTNANSYVWVQVPTFTNNCWIWAYWGNTNYSVTNGPATYTTNGATWDPTQFVGVWHMNEQSTNANAMDSTAYANIGRTNHGVATCSGMAAGGRGMAGDEKFSTSINFSNVAFTIEAWAYPSNSWTSGDNMWGGGNAMDTQKGLHAGLRWPNMLFGTWANDVTGTVDRTGDRQQWHHYAYQIDASGNKTMYRDGILEPSSARIGMYLGVGWNIGGSYGGFQSWKGLLDEVRAGTNVVRSTNWLWATYMTMASNPVFNSYGPVGH